MANKKATREQINIQLQKLIYTNLPFEDGLEKVKDVGLRVEDSELHREQTLQHQQKKEQEKYNQLFNQIALDSITQKALGTCYTFKDFGNDFSTQDKTSIKPLVLQDIERIVEECVVGVLTEPRISLSTFQKKHWQEFLHEFRRFVTDSDSYAQQNINTIQKLEAIIISLNGTLKDFISKLDVLNTTIHSVEFTLKNSSS